MEAFGAPSSRQLVVEAFQSRWGEPPPIIVRAPGRVNLIGEHTDYNDGFVLPMAIDRAVRIALRPRSDGRVIVHSINYGDSTEFVLDSFGKGGPAWGEYIKGVAWSLTQAGHKLSGWEGVLAGDIPIGAGLSSSAAIEVAAARGFAEISHLPWDPASMARSAQLAENEWVGVHCGIMDQLASACGVAGHALLIDCRDLEISPVPLPRQAALMILDTGSRRALATSAYDERRRQCQEAAEFFRVPALRDVGPEDLKRSWQDLPETTRQRARHVVSENERTLRAAEALRRADVVEAGRLMNASHDSLKSDYEVSSRELDAIVDSCRRHPGCYGARLTGAGFGGCAVALVRLGAVEDFIVEVTAGYREATGLEASTMLCGASDGARVERG